MLHNKISKEIGRQLFLYIPKDFGKVFVESEKDAKNDFQIEWSSTAA